MPSRLSPLLGASQRFNLACHIPDEARLQLVSDTRTILTETGGELWSDTHEDLREA